MGKKRWSPGDTISIRLRKEDQDVADYLNQPEKLTADEIINSVRLKASIEKLESGSLEIKPEHVVLLQEMENILSPLIEDIKEIKKNLNQTVQRDETVATKEVSPECKTEDDEAERAMANLTDWDESF